MAPSRAPPTSPPAATAGRSKQTGGARQVAPPVLPGSGQCSAGTGSRRRRVAVPSSSEIPASSTSAQAVAALLVPVHSRLEHTPHRPAAPPPTTAPNPVDPSQPTPAAQPRQRPLHPPAVPSGPGRRLDPAPSDRRSDPTAPQPGTVGLAAVGLVRVDLGGSGALPPRRCADRRHSGRFGAASGPCSTRRRRAGRALVQWRGAVLNQASGRRLVDGGWFSRLVGTGRGGSRRGWAGVGSRSGPR
jgi:hypothetical protein